QSLVLELPAPVDALPARVSGRSPVHIDDVDLSMIAPRIGGDQRFDHLRGRVPLRQAIEPGRAIARIDQRLRRERADAAARMRAQRADGEKTTRDGNTQGATNVARN